MVLQSQTKKTDIFSNRDLINCFIGSITKRGNKQKSIRFFNYLQYAIVRTYGVDGLKFLKILLDNTRPKIFLSSKKIAGIVHKIPTPISVRKSYSMVIHWLVLSASKRVSTGGFEQALFAEINDLYRNPNSSLIKKRDEFHKLAYLNKPFLRYYKF
jgi:ribosomal protein S7